ncbi:MAG: hypothetical protein ACRDI2_11805 [Chloroflexota bacterium]
MSKRRDVVSRPSGWPDPETLIAKAKQGIIDDRTAHLTLADLEALAGLAADEADVPHNAHPTAGPRTINPSDKQKRRAS